MLLVFVEWEINMILGNEYDMSLWYILKVRNKYRKSIIEFIKELPEEFLENIRTAYLKGIDKNVGLDDEEDKFYKVQSNVDSNIYYKFYIMCGDLYIDKIKIINGVSKNLFSLTLIPNNPNHIEQMYKNKEICLGSISTGQLQEISYKELEYDLKKTNFGNMLSHTYFLLGGMIKIKFSRPASIKNMPEEMYREESKQKKLIKKIQNNDIK